MYEAIVVGGRCAGAATAMLLARQGHKVLIVDQASFPSDSKLSTHLIWHAGVDLLHRWGVLDEVLATGAPALTRFFLDMGDIVLWGDPPGTRAGMALAPRRHALDKALLDAAVAAGAHLREGVAFEDVTQDTHGRVNGIRGRLADGSAFTASGRVVIGADGTHSRVARAVAADAYNEHGKDEGSFNMWTYFSKVELDGVEFYGRPERMAYAWDTNDGQVLIGMMQPAAVPRPLRDDVQAHVMKELTALVPGLASRMQLGTREAEWMMGATPAFCRKAAGPGWALVGDAGVTVDPITAAGMSNAFRDAQLLSDLVHEGITGGQIDDALSSYQAKRDAVSVPLLDFAQDMARLAPPTEDVVKLFAALAVNKPQTDRYFGLFAQTVTPAEFFSAGNMARIFAGQP